MSSLLIVLILLGLAVLMVLLTGIALVSPIIVTFDSADGQVRVRWLGFLEFLFPFRAKGGEARVFIAGKAALLRKPATPQVAPEVSSAKESRVRKPKASQRRNFAGRVLWHCLADSAIRRALAKQLARLWRGIWRSAVITTWRADVCLPDPALNGMLMGALALAESNLRSRLSVNFIEQNAVLIEARLYPYRVVKAVLLFLACLPYVSLFRVWRTCSV